MEAHPTRATGPISLLVQPIRVQIASSTSKPRVESGKPGAEPGPANRCISHREASTEHEGVLAGILERLRPI